MVGLAYIGVPFGGRKGGFIPQFRHRLIEDFLVGLIAQVADESALFSTQEVAGAANVEILHGNVDARTQVTEVLEGF